MHRTRPASFTRCAAARDSTLLGEPRIDLLALQNLYSAERWTSVLALFRSTFLSLHSLPSIPLLHMSLQAGLASLKTPICCPPPPPTGNGAAPVPVDSGPSRKSADCPLCSSPLAALAPEVPYSHHVNSTIVCPITGKVVESGEGHSSHDKDREAGESQMDAAWMLPGNTLMALVTPLKLQAPGQTPQAEARAYSVEVSPTVVRLTLV